MHCDCCGDDVGDQRIAYDRNDELYCDWCWPKIKPRIEARIARYKELGHTGDSMCGCSMCAANFERG